MKRKYVMSEGLAFAEEKDMEKLRKYSLQGWHASGFTLMGYVLEKGEKKDYIYNIDYRPLNENEREEYIEFFSSAGWFHVASKHDMHLFRSLPGTKSIYTDRDTMKEKYGWSAHAAKIACISVLPITVLFWFGVYFSSGAINTILSVLAMIFTVISFPLICTAVAAYYQKWKVDERKGLLYFAKTAISLFGIAILILFIKLIVS